uniref:DNA polymerase n=1 Tax=viral metagenome TaxID=1070528 RepID=A0A6C0D9C6_9ZZZZ
MEHSFRVFDFNVYNDFATNDSGSEDDKKTRKDNAGFIIQMFGLNEQGETCSIQVEEFKPFFYVMVNDKWTTATKNTFLAFIKKKIGKYYENSITDCLIIKRKKLYGFDGGKEHKFIKFEFKNMNSYNKVKNLWYTDYNKGHKLFKDGLFFENTNIKLYEANIPPLLRLFHIRDISPSGWIALPKNKTIEITDNKRTTCNYEFIVNYKDIIALNDKEIRVPYKIMSFDIEASSSHGDFPVPIKSYKKLATNIVEYFEGLKMEMTKELCKNILRRIIMAAFGYETMTNIDLVYPKIIPETKKDVEAICEQWLEEPVRANTTKNGANLELVTIEEMFEKMNKIGEDGDDSFDIYNKKHIKQYNDKKATIADILCDKNFEREGKLFELNNSLNTCFPKLEGDKVTFIGSTFMNYGDQEPYKNHCVVLNSCSDMPIQNSVIESYQTEREVLLAWQQLVQRENPDIVIGYNIFGFDYEFMFRRAEETGCVNEFLKLSRNNGEVCGTRDKETNRLKLEESTIQIASGQHDLKFIKMNGRLQVDLYNFFRREENLTSYKLDYVAGHFIGDYIKSFEHSSFKTEIKTTNLTGLLEGSYIHLEEIGHSVDYYDDGAKFKVVSINKEELKFKIDGIINPDMKKKVRWCLAKDDVTPKDIFRMTNGTADDRSVIAKYCIQDCNLVHYLFNKVDVLTGFIEMAKICSVPINFLVMRGQGIKLTSYVAKKCREKRTLIPVIEKGDLDEGYEGAIVLDPKCDLYLDNPVACVDYASLYPSSMISENLSHDSKVWTKEYDLAGNLIDNGEWGEKDENGNFIYDNLAGFEYVNITYDTFKYVRKSPKAAAEKVKSGTKICRFAQFPEGKAIMPSILEELLVARKTTRKLIPQQTDEFMKNVLDKRQLGYKVTANSLYGQCGAKTSTFYEKDIAACTTATGRLLLTYAKKIIEECYGDTICNTKDHGPVLTKAEYIYGDSVANYTPIYVKQNDTIDIVTIENLSEKYGNNKWIACSEEGKQEKEYCELDGIETWTEKGWTKLHRIIRHILADHKKIIRILTHTGLVDVTDDHSLLLKNGEEISPKNIDIGIELLHFQQPNVSNLLDTNNYLSNETDFKEKEAKIMGFFYGDGSCGSYECKSGKKKSWALNNASTVLMNKYLELCKIVYPNFDWVILETLESSNVYKLVPKSKKYGSISEFVENYRKKMYYNKCKIIPNEIMNSSLNIRKAFFEGLYDADGDKDINGYIRIDQKNQISASHICWLASSIGYLTSINTRKDKPDIYRITMTKNKQRKNPCAIKKMQEITSYKGFVYDLTTENHHFAAGIGNMIVHNTDSVFFTFNLQTPEGQPIRGKEALEITIELAQEAGHLASSLLKGPHDLEYEKTFMPFCLLSKKRYVGMLYETDPNKCKRKEMGIVLKRRDNAPIVKDIYGGIIDILMKEQNINRAIEFLQNSLQNIVDEKYPMDKLIITKSLRSGYKNPQSIAHKVLADRMTARDPGNKPGSGDRIPFVYINTPNKKALQGEKIETPNFIKENGLKIDYSFYITNQIMKPVQQVFALVLEKIWELQKKKLTKLTLYKKEVESIKKKYSADHEKCMDKIDDLRNKEIKALLFDKYLRETNNEKLGVKSITTFFALKI